MKILFGILISLISLPSIGQQMEKNSIKSFMGDPMQAGGVPYGVNQTAGKFVDVGDAKLYYEIYGTGIPLVILHGGGVGSIYEMHQFIDSLSQNFQVIAISTRGHGKSGLGNGPTTVVQKANDILAVVNAEKLDKVIVLGFSDGAYSGFSFASTYPEKIIKLIAIGAGEETPELRKISMDLPELYGLDPVFKEQQLVLMPEPERLKEMGDRMAAFYNSTSFSKELFNKIQCPVLVMAGEKDGNAPLQTIITAYLMIPDSQLSIVPNTGHVVFNENFSAVWASMKPFLEE
ncbi:alpha/beta hydrolase [Algoriphagus sp.]|jgi:pimeloyl-ACP methyl ester carboxylesterase|uniref:alpha/beta fold hydrolase n=2 Tax=Algoriphagus sp. TaxID=1872435 RepID=UPI00329A428B